MKSPVGTIEREGIGKKKCEKRKMATANDEKYRCELGECFWLVSPHLVSFLKSYTTQYDTRMGRHNIRKSSAVPNCEESSDGARPRFGEPVSATTESSGEVPFGQSLHSNETRS